MIAQRGLKAAALQQQHIPPATHPLHSACSTRQCSQTVTGAALGAQRREVRLEEGPQLSANAAPISFHELGLSPFFSFEEKAIKNYLMIVPSSSLFISTARTLTTMSEGMKDDLNYQQKGCSESKGNLHIWNIWLSKFLTPPWLFLPSAAAAGAQSSTISRPAVLLSCRSPPHHLNYTSVSHHHSRPNTINSYFPVSLPVVSLP